MTQDEMKIIAQLQQIITSITAAGGTVSDELQHQVTLATQQLLSGAGNNNNDNNTTQTQKNAADYTGILNGNYDAITKNTFMDDDFYRFLFNAPLFRGKKHNFVPEDKIEFTVTKLEIMAKNIGGTELLRSFKKMCKLKKEEVKKIFLENRRKEREEQEKRYAIDGFITKFKDLPDNATGNKFVSPIWNTSMGFVAKEEMGKDGNLGKLVTACELPALINRQVVTLGADTSIAKEEYELLYRDGQNHWRTKIADRGQLVNARRVIELADYGLGIDGSTAGNFASYMASMIAEQAKRGGFQTLYTTDKLLVKKDGKLVLSYNDDEITFSKQEEFSSLVRSLQPKGDKNEWYEAIKKCRKAAHKEDFNFILAAMFTAPLVSVLGTQGFMCETYGPSQTGKSVMTQICATVWGDMDKKDGFVFSATNTGCFSETTMDTLNGLPFILDDFNALKEEEKRQFAPKIMMLANGRGKGRSNKNLGQRMTSFSLTGIISSEEPISTYLTTGGAYNRLISKRYSVERGNVPWYKENGDSAMADVIRFFSSNYGHAGADFIDAINKIEKSEIEKIKDTFDSELRKRAKREEKTDGQVQPLAIIMTASYLIEKHLFKDGIVMTYDDALACMTDADVVDQSMRFYRKMEDKFSLNADKFEGMHESNLGYDECPENFRGGFWGVYEESFINIEDKDKKIPAIKRTLSIYPAILEKWALEEKINIKMFYDDMRARGLLIADKDKNTKKVTVKHLSSRPRMVQIVLPAITLNDEKDNEDADKNIVVDSKSTISIPDEWNAKEENSFIKAAMDVKDKFMSIEDNPFSDID